MDSFHKDSGNDPPLVECSGFNPRLTFKFYLELMGVTHTYKVISYLQTTMRTISPRCTTKFMHRFGKHNKTLLRYAIAYLKPSSTLVLLTIRALDIPRGSIFVGRGPKHLWTFLVEEVGGDTSNHFLGSQSTIRCTGCWDVQIHHLMEKNIKNQRVIWSYQGESWDLSNQKTGEKVSSNMDGAHILVGTEMNYKLTKNDHHRLPRVLLHCLGLPVQVVVAISSL